MDGTGKKKHPEWDNPIPVILLPSHVSHFPSYHTCSSVLLQFLLNIPQHDRSLFTFLIFAVIPYYILTSKDSEQETIKTHVACVLLSLGDHTQYNTFYLSICFQIPVFFTAQLQCHWSVCTSFSLSTYQLDGI